MDWDSPYIESLITATLQEDVGLGDAGAAATVSPGASTNARIVTEQHLVCAGLPLVQKIFSRLDPEVSVELQASEGHEVPPGTFVANLSGNAGAILTAEQIVLNFLTRLSGIATATREYVKRIAGTPAKIRDTLNTAPGLRRLEQYAIHIAGGTHHRLGLYDSIVLKRSHILMAGGVRAALDQTHSHTSRLVNPLPLTAYEGTGTVPSDSDADSLSIQIEIGDESELREALSAGADSLLLNDQLPAQVSELVRLARELRHDCTVEVSGEISLDAVRAYAETGADYVSPAALIRSAPRANLRLLVDRQDCK
jgi:nicotinate-nucleotide pyrophosphorylase (carboxylating)